LYGVAEVRKNSRSGGGFLRAKSQSIQEGNEGIQKGEKKKTQEAKGKGVYTAFQLE